MSRETLEWLNSNTLIGYTAQRGTAWHYRAGATNHFDGPVPLEEVRKILGWEPLVLPHTYEFAGEVRTSNRINVLRPDTGDLLGVFQHGYTPHPYPEWLVSKVEVLLGDQLGIGSAGMLRNGAVAWVSVEVPETVTVPSVGEAFRPSLLATTSFDGSLATTYKRVATRVVCDNTLNIGLGEHTPTVRVKHTRDSLGRLDVITARQALGIVFQMADEFTHTIEALCASTVTDRQWDQFLLGHMGERPEENKGGAQTKWDNRRDGLTDMYRTDARVAPWTNTAWGVLQAVNTYQHHETGLRGTLRGLRNMDLTVTGDYDLLDSKTLSTLETVLGGRVLLPARAPRTVVAMAA